MKIKKITPETFGDPKQFPILCSISDILNEMIKEDPKNQSYVKYISSFLQEMKNRYDLVNHMEKLNRLYFNILIKKDFLNRLERSNLPDKLHTHLANFVVGYHRNLNERMLGIYF